MVYFENYGRIEMFLHKKFDPIALFQWFLPNKLNSKHLFPSIQDSTSMHTKYWISLFSITLDSKYLWNHLWICKFKEWIYHTEFVIGSLGYLWVSHLLWIWLKSCRSIPRRRFRKLLSSAELSEVLRDLEYGVLWIFSTWVGQELWQR